MNLCEINQLRGDGDKKKLKHYHHVQLDHEFKEDCRVWMRFLTATTERKRAIAHLFIDLSRSSCDSEETLSFTSDATANKDLGFGSMLDSSWLYGKWEPGFVNQYKPSIEFLELYALCMGVFVWSDRLKNRRIAMFCDNEAVVHMVNNTTSGCKYCMVLIRKLVLKCINNNMQIFMRHLKGIHNQYSDFLSRLKI